MKRRFVIVIHLIAILALWAICVLSGCKKDAGLTPHVSQLRSRLYSAECDDITVQAAYGFREQPFINDGKVGNIVHSLTFRITDAPSDAAERIIIIKHNNVEYKATFKLNALSNSLTASINIEEFDKRTFDGVIIQGSSARTVTFESIVPNNTMDYSRALSYFEKNQPALKQSFTDAEGNFCAEIYARIIVKDGKGYWYLGFADGGDRLKALLIDGENGEVLAVRDVL